MRKKLFISVGIVAALCIGGYIYADNTLENEIIISADHMIYDNYDMISDDSELILEVKATSNKENVIKDFGDYYTGHTVTEVNINQVFKSNGVDLKPGDSIKILEPTYTHDQPGISLGTIIYNYEDYTPLQEGLDYAVFLKWDEQDQGYWIRSLEQGKFNIPAADTTKVSSKASLSADVTEQQGIDVAEIKATEDNVQYQSLKEDVLNNLYK
ncbi:hypothetical protein [Paenibacillus xylanilyticus]|uniref:hypothetical protein n=1 Tax=Paenibacillus xylanilyticus TaxID=248903 RepID=UPI0039A25473